MGKARACVAWDNDICREKSFALAFFVNRMFAQDGKALVNEVIDNLCGHACACTCVEGLAPVDFCFARVFCYAEGSFLRIGWVNIADFVREVSFDDEDAAMAGGGIKGKWVIEIDFGVDCFGKGACFFCGEGASDAAGNERIIFRDGGKVGAECEPSFFEGNACAVCFERSSACVKHVGIVAEKCGDGDVAFWSDCF